MCELSLLLVAALATAIAAESAARSEGGGTTAVSIPPSAREVLAVTPTGETLVLETARTEEERAVGLMGRSEVPPGTGMLFLFPVPGNHPFWMFNCRISLDLVWLDASGTVVDVKVAAPACPKEPCPTYSSRAAASFVIEVAAHEAARLGLEPGARVLLSPAPDRDPR